MVNIIIYDDKVAPLYQLLNNNCMLDLLKTIQSYRNTSIIKLSYIDELKSIQDVAKMKGEPIIDIIRNDLMCYLYYYKYTDILSML